MTKEERKSIRANAQKKYKGDVDAAIAEFLGCQAEYAAAGGVPSGYDGSFHGIRSELELQKD